MSIVSAGPLEAVDHLKRTLLACLFFGTVLLAAPLVAAQQPVPASICAVMNDPPRFAGLIVRLRATVNRGFELSTIVDANQPSCGGPWLEIAPKKDSLSDQNSHVESRQLESVFLVEDENMKRFDDALDAVVYPRENKTLFIGGSPPRYLVTATLTGRVDYAGEEGLGFGHMNGWRVRFVLSSVEDVATEEISYDWTRFSRDPVRFPHGTIRGRLTDAEGKPIRSAWVAAIPAEGPVSISSAEVLTKEDGSYLLDVKPGRYFGVVNRDNPANAEVPVLTTYFPSAEDEASATLLNVADYVLLSGIDIQIHRVLVPHFLGVRVLLGEEPANGAYVYLTQTNRAPIVGPHGVTHTDSEGQARLQGFEGLDYLLWADLGSWPNKRCAPVVALDRNHIQSDPIVVRISLTQDACSKQEREARSEAYATLPRRAHIP
jgi:hypothetical protein